MTDIKSLRLPRAKVFAKINLRILRITNGLTLAEAAQQVGYSVSAYGKIERRDNGLNIRRTKDFCEFYGVEFNEIFEIIR
jgi:transcriptional regulator with XRE-family HTH domain